MALVKHVAMDLEFASDISLKGLITAVFNVNLYVLYIQSHPLLTAYLLQVHCDSCYKSIEVIFVLVLSKLCKVHFYLEFLGNVCCV
jgi:hypothetical protein